LKLLFQNIIVFSYKYRKIRTFHDHNFGKKILGILWLLFNVLIYKLIYGIYCELSFVLRTP